MNAATINTAAKVSTAKEATIIDKIKCPYVWMTTAAMAISTPLSVFAGSNSQTAQVDFGAASKPIVNLVNQVIGPIISVVAALAAIYCVFLGVKLAKADEPQEREKAKMALKNAIIGFFLIFILIVVLRVLTPQLARWVDQSTGASGNPKIEDSVQGGTAPANQAK